MKLQETGVRFMTEENNLVWENFIGLLKNRISTVSINSWFKYCKIYKIDDAVQDNKSIKVVTIMTSSQYIKDALIKRYLETIEELMESILGKNCNIEFVLEEELNQERLEEQKETTPTEPTTVVEKPVSYQQNFETNLSPKYTFENFIVGENSNRLAYEGARHVAEQPGKLFNPFLFMVKVVSVRHISCMPLEITLRLILTRKFYMLRVKDLNRILLRSI